MAFLRKPVTTGPSASRWAHSSNTAKAATDPFFKMAASASVIGQASITRSKARAEFRDVAAITAAGASVQFPMPALFQDLFFDENATAQLNLPAILHFSLYQRFDRQFAVMVTSRGHNGVACKACRLFFRT